MIKGGKNLLSQEISGLTIWVLGGQLDVLKLYEPKLGNILTGGLFCLLQKSNIFGKKANLFLTIIQDTRLQMEETQFPPFLLASLVSMLLCFIKTGTLLVVPETSYNCLL